jgi:stage II sporulation protein GA (sporulation sigma-E factor processing peptidase)
LDGQWENLRSYGQENATNFFVSWGYTDGKEVTHMVVYADLAIILNFAVDLCLLLGTNRLSGYGTSWKRVLPAAVLGSVYGAACLLPGMQFMGNMLWRVVILILMSLIAFGATVSGLRRGILFVFLSMALGGIVVEVGRGDMCSLLVSAAILSLMCVLGFRRKTGKTEYVTVLIRHREKKVQMMALIDTGNTLKDPVTGCGVLVADARAAMELLQLDQTDLQHPIETISRGKHSGLRLIPYCAVGQPSGMLLGLRVDELRINGKESDQIVAFAPQRIGQGIGYEALTGGIL